MNRKLPYWLRTFTIVAAATAPAWAPAQSVPPENPPPEDDVVTLSPFTVAAEADVGYEASSTLAGTGLNTRVTDLGSSVSIVTSKFLEDTASRDLRDLLVYQTGVEATGFGGNYSGQGSAGGGFVVEPANNLTAGLPGTRVRGLASATNARNFFRNSIPVDSFNIDRVETAPGEISLLFGVGSPAGIINTQTTQANLNRTRGSVELSYGSHDSWRGVFRYNHVLLPNELALFVAGVKDETSYQQKFTYQNSDRLYFAGAWDIAALRNRGVLDSTVIRASFENGKIEHNRPRVIPPSDRLSSWFDATLPEDLKARGATGKVSYDPTTGPFNVFNRARGNATIGVIDNVNRSPTFIFQSPTATMPRDNIQVPGQIVLGRPFVSNNVYYPNTGLTGIAVGAYSRELNRVRSDLGVPDQIFYTAPNITDTSIFDFFNNTLVGPNFEGLNDLEAIDVTVEQLLFDRQVGVELAFSQQTWEQGYQSLLPAQSPYISIDVNTHMWTGEENPNFGRPFISTGGNATYLLGETETQRAKAFYRLDLEEKIDNRLGWILGRQTFSLLGQREVYYQDNRGGGSVHYTPDVWQNAAGQARTAAQGKKIVNWVYLGPSLFDADTPAGANLSGLQQNLMNFHEHVPGGVLVGRMPAPNAAAAQLPQYQPYYTPLTVLRETRKVENTASFASLSERTLKSQAFSMQGNWLGDHLVSTIGWRKEEVSTLAAVPRYDPNGEGYVLVNDPSYSINAPGLVPQEFEDTLFAWSIVAKTPRTWVERIPGVSSLNLYFGKSENFSPAGSQTVTWEGEAIAPPTGITEEAGVYLEAFDGRVTARLNFYETTQTGESNAALRTATQFIVQAHANAAAMVVGGSLPDGGNGFPPNYVAPPQELLDTFNVQRQSNGTVTWNNPGVTDTMDFVSEGIEFEVGFRPTAGLSFIFNVAKQEAERSNIGAATRRLLYETPTATGEPLAVEWRKPWANSVPLNTGALPKAGTGVYDQNLLDGWFQNFTLNPLNTQLANEGAKAHELREWRANFVGNYQFQEGPLKGWGAGVGVRWQDEAALGYPVTTIEADGSPDDGVPEPSDIRTVDVRNPFYGPDETRYDAWVSYSTKLFNGRYPVKFQLNVRNLNVDDELVPQTINPDGQVANYYIAEGRRYTFSVRFEF